MSEMTPGMSPFLSRFKKKKKKKYQVVEDADPGDITGGLEKSDLVLHQLIKIILQGEVNILTEREEAYCCHTKERRPWDCNSYQGILLLSTHGKVSNCSDFIEK